MHVAELHESQVAERRAYEQDADKPDVDEGFDPPSREEFKAVPWSGPGPDPLEEAYRRS